MENSLFESQGFGSREGFRRQNVIIQVRDEWFDEVVIVREGKKRPYSIDALQVEDRIC